MKKYSWIVALLLALSFALFIGCGADPNEKPIGKTYRDVELGDMNVWAGAPEKQKGWGTDGLIFKGAGDKLETAADKGYKLEDFLGAEYLVLELADGHPSDGMSVIWGLGEQDGGGWNSGVVMTDGKVMNPCGKLEGNVLTIDLVAAWGASYNQFSSPANESMRILIQYWNQGVAALGIKKATLMVSDEKPPFVAITKIDLKNADGYEGSPFALQADITPADATMSKVIWAYDTTTTGANNTYTWKTDADWFVIPDQYDPDEEGLDETVWPFDDITIPGEVSIPSHASSDTFKTDDNVTGKITFRAIVKDGRTVVAADVGKVIPLFEGSGKATDTGGVGAVTSADVGKQCAFVSGPLTVTIAQRPKINITGITGVTQILLNPVAMSIDVDAGFASATFTKNAGYQASYFWWVVDFGASGTLSDYTDVKMNIEGVGGDTGYKDLALMAAPTNASGDNNPFGAGLGNDAKIFELLLNKPRYDDWNSGGGGGNASGDEDIWVFGPQTGDGAFSATDFTFEFDDGVNADGANGNECPYDEDKLAAADGRYVFFGFYFPGSAGAKFKINSIEFE